MKSPQFWLHEITLTTWKERYCIACQISLAASAPKKGNLMLHRTEIK
jgi:hypothetical protein